MPWRSDDISAAGLGRVLVRASAPCTLYEADTADGENSILLAAFTGERRVRLTKPFVNVQCEGDVVWFDPAQNQSTTASSEIVYTTLDRPAALSPEMLAIQQLVRRNDLEREQMREDMKRLEYGNLRLHSAKNSYSTAEAGSPLPEEDDTEAIREGSDESDEVSSERKSDADSEEVSTPRSRPKGRKRKEANSQSNKSNGE
ncbi:hypothetical protein [Microviridae sp.]|nr:hypothetical protein [Microviridae sp.]